jgi:nitrile hydratase accessory protein
LSPPELPQTPPPPEAAFAAPWQARAFALTLAAHEAGLFTWPEWSAALGRALEGAAPDGSDYYLRWLVALEGLLEAPRPRNAERLTLD